ncbi:restriction endonuclease subunit S [Echinicola marina]|uniref:Restriction endonuclease subunit S n=1 Tax=Echinicola rosea TaxID=1807691 RepID=A0ABQ1V686_9BACT|nr:MULTISPECIES: restriction endonuclease subunit S [Echinicola]UCS94316.1 restriction endonuclease subunit S [Echinicola marina]GGF38440.1 restriction endonuclease subunit S [Echinicola rosea]
MKIPDSVKPGIPKLPSKIPSGWNLLTMNKVFNELNRKAKVEDDVLYDLVTVKRSRGGVQKRERLRGDQISVKSQFFIKENDFLISRRQIVHGACGVVPKELDGSIVSNEYLVLKVNPDFDLNFIKYYSHSQYFQQTCFHSSIGVHVEKMIFKPHWWYKFKHILPNLKEQKKIALILSTWDSVILKYEQIIDVLSKRNKGLAQQLLTGKLRLEGYNDSWINKPLGHFFTERKETGFTELPLLSVGESGVYPQNGSNKKDTSNSDKEKYKRICPGDIGYNTMRMWQGRSAISELEGIVSPAYTIVTPKNNADVLFFSFLFKQRKMVHKFFRNSQGLVDDTLNCKFKDFKIIMVEVPNSINEQKAIAAVLSEAKKELTIYQQQLDILKEQKKGLIQKLLTGEIRVNIKEN